jgi:hypothetical protein
MRENLLEPPLGELSVNLMDDDQSAFLGRGSPANEWYIKCPIWSLFRSQSYTEEAQRSTEEDLKGLKKTPCISV